MYYEVVKLLKDLNPYQEILIYGTGNYAMDITRIMKKINLWGKVSNFVVSSLKNIEKKLIDNVPVVTLEQVGIINDDTIIFVAVSEQYLEEIGGFLHERGFGNNILFLTDYMKQEDLEIWDDRRDFSELYRYITEWCLCNQVADINNSVISGEGHFNLIPKKKDLQKADKKLIVFITGMITARTSRIVKALSKIGFYVRILKWHANEEYVGEAEVRRNGIEIINCTSAESILYFAQKDTPLVYCIDPPWEQNVISRIMLIYREYFGKIVLAPYDVLNFTHIRGRKENFILEKYALENADGVVWRYFSKNALQEKLGFDYKGDSIEFLDYCAEYELPPKNYDDKVLKLCCLPTHTKPFLQNIDKDFGLSREATVGEIMNKIGARRDCEFHVFLWEIPDEEDVKVLNRIKQQYFNFYYYVRIDHEKLISMISEYDYGCVLSIDGKIPEWPNTLNVGLEPYYTEGAYKFAAQNKFYDFLNAHLPIIATFPRRLCEVLSEYNVIVDMSLEGLDIDFLRDNKEAFYENAVKAHEKLLIDNHISKLIDFFNKVYEEKW